MRTIRTIILLIATFSTSIISAQNDVRTEDIHIPYKFAATVGGGLSIPDMNTGYNTFFSNHTNTAGLSLLAEGTYYFNENVGVGLQYNRSQCKADGDRMNMNFIGPKGTLRTVFANGKQGAFISLGLGLMNYNEKMYDLDSHYNNHNNYTKNYFAANLSLGYEFAIMPGVTGVLRADVLTADWFFNPNYDYFDDDYDDHDNPMFKNNVTFVNLGFALSFGL